ncbi:MAG: hypothetical protein ACXWLM_13380 [Myxococcales bacterium]
MGFLLAMLIAQAQPSPPAPPPEPAKAERPPLSKEDRELVKELALLEQLELVKNLELFEADKDSDKPPEPPQRQP